MHSQPANVNHPSVFLVATQRISSPLANPIKDFWGRHCTYEQLSFPES